MKTPFPNLWVQTGFRLGMIAVAWLAGRTPVQAYKKDGLNIMVQSSVEDRRAAKGKGAAASASRGKVYFLAPALRGGGPLRMVKPVDTGKLEAEVQEVLQAKGYRRVTRGETPDMTITILYGRGFIHNPYPSPVPGIKWSIRDATKLNNAGYVPFSGIIEGKRQTASEEKLAIIIAAWAWDPPAMIKHRAKLLWRTMVYIDDPAHRDLNTIANELLAAGAAYFDRETDIPEVEISRPLPEGHVKIGPTRVIEQPARESK